MDLGLLRLREVGKQRPDDWSVALSDEGLIPALRSWTLSLVNWCGFLVCKLGLLSN